MSNTLVMFGATWCQPCKRTRPVVIDVAHVAGVEFEYVDVETYDFRANDVTTVPTLRVYSEDGEVIAEHIGAANAAQVGELIKG